MRSWFRAHGRLDRWYPIRSAVRIRGPAKDFTVRDPVSRDSPFLESLHNRSIEWLPATHCDTTPLALYERRYSDATPSYLPTDEWSLREGPSGCRSQQVTR